MNFSYGQNIVLQNVSMCIKPGEIVGMTGPVGAGKSTLLRLLVGLLEPDNGIVQIDGYSSNAKRFREMVGVLFQHSSRKKTKNSSNRTKSKLEFQASLGRG